MVSGFNSRGRCAVRLAVVLAAVSALFAIFAVSALATTVSVRIEGGTHTVFDRSVALTAVTMTDTDGAAHVESGNALSTVEIAARLVGFSYELKNYPFGLFMNSIAAEQPVMADPWPGWSYHVNHASPSVGAGDYTLHAGDRVLWYYGTYDEQEAAVVCPATYVAVGATATVGSRYWTGANSAAVLPTATVQIGSTVVTSGVDGLANVRLTEPGDYAVRVEKPGFIRSGTGILHIRYATSLATLFASKTTVARGSSVSLHGTLVAKGAATAGKTVVLMSRTKSSAAWTRVASAKTGSAGAFRFSVKPASTRAYRVVFAGDSALGDATGSPRTITVR